MKRLLIYLKDYKKECVLAPLFKMLEASFELFVPLVIANMIDSGIAGQNKGVLVRDFGILVLLGFIFTAVCLVIIMIVFNHFKNRSLRWTLNK